MKRNFEVEVRSTVTVSVDLDLATSEYGNALNPGRFEGIYDDIDDERKVIAHLAYNAVANRRDNAKNLDGFADLPAEAVQMSVDTISDPFDVIEVT